MKFIPHNQPIIDLDAEITIIKSVLQSKQLVKGLKTKEFEDQFCKYVGLPSGHAVAVSNGSAGVLLSLIASDLNQDFVDLPGYICNSVFHAIKLSGNIPNFIDNVRGGIHSDLRKYYMSKSKACIIYHTFGYPQFFDLGSLNNKVIIEDCSHALGSFINGQHVGLKGDYGVFSFYGSKVITTLGNGGMIISRSKELIEKVKKVLNYDEATFNETRFNFNISEVQSAIGTYKLKHLNEQLGKRRKIFEIYKDLPGLLFFESSEIIPNYYRILIDANYYRSGLQDHLDSCKIKSIYPISENEIIPNLANAKYMARNVISLPAFPELSEIDLNYIIKCLHEWRKA